MKLLKALREYLNPPDAAEVQSLRAALAERTQLHAEQLEESDAQWREQLAELINQHCDERRKWAREKRQLIELEQRARTAMDNTQALMTPHLSGKTRVASVGNVRMQIDVPAEDASDPMMLLSGFAWLLIDAGYDEPSNKWVADIKDLLDRTPPLVSEANSMLEPWNYAGNRLVPPPLTSEDIKALQNTNNQPRS